MLVVVLRTTALGNLHNRCAKSALAELTSRCMLMQISYSDRPQARTGGLPGLDGKESENALHREGATVHKVAVEEVRVVLGGQAVELEDVQQVEVLRETCRAAR